MNKCVAFEIIERPGGQYSFNIIFLDTGEIRQKRRSKEWLMRRVFFHELRTWAKGGETIKYDKEGGDE